MARFHKLTISDIRRETTDSVSIAFDVPEKLEGHYLFQPGQYLTLRATVEGEDIRRAYSICSAPYEKAIRVGIKQVSDGAFSTHANTALKVGDVLDVMTPQGRFGPQSSTAANRHYLGVAAGSGITPILAILKAVLAESETTRFTLVYGNRTSQAIMFGEELEDLRNIYLGRLTIVHVLSREAQDVPILTGRIDGARIRALSKHVIALSTVTEALLCGPAAMVETVRETLLTLGLPADCVHAELFSAAPRRQNHKPVALDGAKAVVLSRITAVYDGKRHAFDLLEGDASILDAAERAGIDLPYSCKGGMCCTCRCHVDEGAAEMQVNYSLEPWELQAGFVLGCQVRPLTETLTLDFDQV